MKFIDEVKIYIKSGDGGSGCTAFRREKFIPFGGPDGGDGGKGGDIIIRAIHGLNTLIDFRYKQHFRAQKGSNGMGKNRHGKNGERLIIEVPVGTEIIDDLDGTVIADLTYEGQEFMIAKGGDGGLGNNNFKSSVNRAPERSTPGWPGEELWVWMRLKLLSDAGLLGLPNAGKSSFLAAVTSATPKIADYPFTTLKPQLGVVSSNYQEFVIADIPGLIEGAHEGVGLGDRFLKHIERCQILLHVIDGSQEDVVGAYKTIRHELEMFSDDLCQKDEIIALNKCDLLNEKELKQKISSLKKYSKKEIFPISAAARQNLDPVVNKLIEVINSYREK